MSAALLFSVFVVATCGLIYELVMGTLASYLLGDSVTQFSTVIGVYLFAMGVGSWLSRYVTRNFILTFVKVELLVGLLGGFSAAFLFSIFELVQYFRVILYLLIFIIGTLVGLEIPLLMRILKERMEFGDLVSKVLSFDYVGALVASVLFPLVLAPQLGLMRTSFLFGLLNVLVAIWVLVRFGREIPGSVPVRRMGIAILLLLTFGFIYSDRLLSYAEATMYPNQVIYAHSSKYQRIVITRGDDDIKLYLNGNLQFSSRDEYRYHEALVHVGMSRLREARKVLVLGGGDGMAVRELLKYPEIESITLVDLDPQITNLFRTNEFLSRLNGDALNSERVQIVNTDAFLWVRDNKGYDADFIVVDLPDPTSFSIGKLYTTSFFKALKGTLAPDGLLAVQSTSPLFARQSYWCVEATLRESGFQTAPYHAYVPSFGEWGYILGAHNTIGATPVRELPSDLKFVSIPIIDAMFQFPDDMARTSTEINKLNNQVLVSYYEKEWGRYVQ